MSQAQAMTRNDHHQYLHALSRYGIWAEYLARELADGKVSAPEAIAMLHGFAAIQRGAFAKWGEPPASIPEIHVNPSEGEMDLLIGEEMVGNAKFFAWLLEQAAQPPGSLISVGRSQATVHGETDLLVIYETLEGIRRALLIEDKIAAVFMPDQDRRYRKRLDEGIRAGQWSGGATVLIAPQKYLDGAGGKDFDAYVSYEAALHEIEAEQQNPRTAFKAAMLRAASGKAAKPWVKVGDERLSAFYEELIAHALARNPELPIPHDRRERAPTSKWIVFGLPNWPRNRVSVEIKPHNGVVDLRLAGVTHQAAVDVLARGLGPGMSIAVARGSIAIRLLSPRIDVDQALAPQIALWEAMLDNCRSLMRFLNEQAGGFQSLVGATSPTNE